MPLESSEKYVRVTSSLALPLTELQLSFSRSSGAGGQNVNKVNTKATLHFDVLSSQSLTDQQKERIIERLPSRLSKDQVLYLSASEHRSQKENRAAVIERFSALLRYALTPPPKKRKATRPSKKAIERRLEAKRKRASIKQQRGKVRQ